MRVKEKKPTLTQGFLYTQYSSADKKVPATISVLVHPGQDDHQVHLSDMRGTSLTSQEI